jgi:GNAT superfamily N-acetyltransferase
MLLQYVLNEQCAHFTTMQLDPDLKRNTPVVVDEDEEDRDVLQPTAHCRSMFFPFEHIRQLVRDASRSLVVIATCADGPPDNHTRVVGMCWWTTAADLRRTTPEVGESPYDMHIQHVSVLHSHRRRGIGTKLLNTALTGWLWHHQNQGRGALPPGVTIRSWLQQPVPRGQAAFWTRHRYHPMDVLDPAQTVWRCDLATGAPPLPPQQLEERHPVLARAQQPLLANQATTHPHQMAARGFGPGPGATAATPHYPRPTAQILSNSAQHALAMQLSRLAEETADAPPVSHQPTSSSASSGGARPATSTAAASGAQKQQKKKKQRKRHAFNDDDDSDSDFTPSSARKGPRSKYL